MNYSYVTLLTDDTYTYGIVLLVETMKKCNTKYPLHVLITEDVSEPSLVILKQLGLTYSLVNKIEIPNEIHEYNSSINPKTAGIWRYCYTKFHVFNQTQFDKIIFLDADIMLLKNIDHLFDCPHMTAALDDEYYNEFLQDTNFKLENIIGRTSIVAVLLLNHLINYTKIS